MNLTEAKNKKVIYLVKVDSHFSSIKQLSFDKMVSDFYGAGTIQFKIIRGQYHSTQQVVHRRFVKEQFDSELLYDTFDEAVVSLRERIVDVMGYDDSNYATREVLLAEVNRRFGLALDLYYFNDIKIQKDNV